MTDFLPLQELTAAALNAHFPLSAYASSDQGPLANQAAVQDDDALFVVLPANKAFGLLGRLWWSSTSATPDFRVSFSGPPLATMTHSLIAQPTGATSGAGTVDTGVATTITAEHTRGTINGDLSGLLLATVFMGANAGTVRLRWSQAISDPATVTRKAGSWIYLFPLN